MNDIHSFLENHNIRYKEYVHEPLFTVEDSKKVHHLIPAEHTKNLFLIDKYKKVYLVCVRHDKRLMIKDFAKKYEIKDLSFAKEDVLFDHLRTTPGSVSLFGVIFSPTVRLFIDEDLFAADYVGWHPNDNTKTWRISHEGLEKFLHARGGEYSLLTIPESSRI